MRPDATALRRILESGILAPSAENRHYLRFQVLHDSVRLLSTDHASWVDRPHRKVLAFLAYGAVLENLALRSAELGYALTADRLPDPQPPDQVALLRWEPTSAAPDPLCSAIEARHTNRRFYRRARLPAQTLARLSAAARASPGADVLWLDNRHDRALALQAIRIAETERFRQRELHAELFKDICWDIGWQNTADHGLPPAALQVEWPMRRPFALLRHWKVMRMATWLGAHRALGLRAGYLPCALAPHIGLLVMQPRLEGPDNLLAGRAFQRVWLAATAERLALQPMAAATVLAIQRAGQGWVSAGVQARLQQRLQALCGHHDAQPALFFRLGQADAPSAVAGRRPLDEYLS